MTEERAARVKQIAEHCFGSVLSRDGDAVWVEIPCDLSGAFMALAGAGGFSPQHRGVVTKPAFRRVTTMRDQTIVLENEPMVPSNFYRYAVPLSGRPVAVTYDPPAKQVAAITAQKPR